MTQNGDKFSEKQLRILEHYVTNTDKDVFCLRNLPEVIKGALFSRYSRSSLGLRSLLIKEFVSNEEEAAFEAIVGRAIGEESEDGGNQIAAIKQAQNFYDRILDGYGDDSIGELGGAHLAVENLSMIAAKVIEETRIGGSPLEKSTRYVYFDQKINGQYQYYREPVLMTSAYRDLYIQTCDLLFETYSRLSPPLTALIEKGFPCKEGSSKAAYQAALRAKVLDCLRGLLPGGTLTNMGVYGNGRFFQQLIHKLQCHSLTELQDIGKQSFTEMSKVIPSFVRRADLAHRHHQEYAEFHETMRSELSYMTAELVTKSQEPVSAGVHLVDYDHDAVAKVAAALLFHHSDRSLLELVTKCRDMSEEQLARILDAACSARENRRHKSPRALEHAFFTFEIVADFGVYRDLQRHRLLTQDRQLLSCDHGYFIPDEIIGTDMESDYRLAMDQAKQAFEAIRPELPEEAQYVVPMAYNIRWYFHVNLRALQWLCELRSGAAGHPTYRHIAQSMAKQVSEILPSFERFFKFVDYEGYQLGRLGQEERKEEKQKQTPR